MPPRGVRHLQYKQGLWVHEVTMLILIIDAIYTFAICVLVGWGAWRVMAMAISWLMDLPIAIEVFKIRRHREHQRKRTRATGV